jgi:hypothetical protein
MAKRRSFLALAAALVILSCPQDTPDEDAGETDAELAKDLMGMVHAGERGEYALLDELGVEWMLRDFSWSSIQSASATWNIDAYKTYADGAETNGKKILALLDYDTGWVHGSKPSRGGVPYI